MSAVSQFGNEGSGALERLSAVFTRRWVRWLLAALLVLLAGWTAYFQIWVKPQLTADRYRVRVAGESSTLVVEVDEDGPLLAMKGGVAGLSELILTGDALYIRADDVDAETDMTWVQVPLTEIPLTPDSWLLPPRVKAALSIGVKECRPLSGDAALLVSAMLKEFGPNDGARLCHETMQNIIDRGVLIDSKAVRPGDLTEPPLESVVALTEVPNGDQVLADLASLLGRT